MVPNPSFNAIDRCRVMVRGLRVKVDDRHELNGIVAQVLEKYQARAHAFCWMTNHLHLLAQISDRKRGRIYFSLRE
jgi:REP element-mobilizing transposase RayT